MYVAALGRIEMTNASWAPAVSDTVLVGWLQDWHADVVLLLLLLLLLCAGPMVTTQKSTSALAGRLSHLATT